MGICWVPVCRTGTRLTVFFSVSDKDTGCDFRTDSQEITPGVLEIDYREVEAVGGLAGSIRSSAP
jgi:hypothetical protein